MVDKNHLTRIRFTRGFTLVELMITVAIMGILTAVALPSYQNYVLSSHRIEAQSALSDIYLQQISHFQESYSFATLASGNLTIPNTDNYTIAIPTASTSAFTITATAKGNQLSDTDCKVFTINQLNARTSTNSSGSDSSSECW